MAMAEESTDDVVAYRLLGWPSEDNATQNNALAADENYDPATSFHSKVRTTADGATNFRRAMQILSGEEGLLIFHEETDHREGGGRYKDPLLIVKGYFRLIKCSLEPAAATAATPSYLSEDEWLRMTCEMLKKLGDSLREAIQNQILLLSSQKTSNSPASTPMNIRRSSQNAMAVVYYFQSIIKIIHPHIITNRIRLLGPAYRSFCDVADSFLSLLDAEKTCVDKFVSAFLPSVGWEALSGLQNDVDKLSKLWKECMGLFEQAAFHLLEFIDDRLENFRRAILGQECSSLSPEKQSKVIVFLFARVTSLVLMTTRIQNSFKDEAVVSNKSSSDVKEGGRKLINGFLQRLVKVCSLSLVAHASLEEDTVNRSRAALLSAVGLRPKAEQYLTKILGDLDSKNASIIRLGLECFIEFPSFNEIDIIQGNSLAKLLLMKYIMEKLFETGPILFSETKTLVNFYETLLFDIPKCHHFFQTSSSGYNLQNQAMEIFSDLVCVLENVSHMLCHSKIIGGPDLRKNKDEYWQKAIVQQHHLLIHWLAPASTNHNLSTPTSPSHPITNEFLLHILQKRIILSCAIDDHYSQHDATHLISLLSQLLFHHHTEKTHRRNIATLLIRLLSPSSNTKKSKKQNDAMSLTIQLLWSNMTKANIINSTPRKRKRSRGAIARPAFLSDDVCTICWVLEALAKSSVLARTSIDSEVSLEIGQLWDGILNKSNNTGKKNQVMFLLSLSVGAVRATSNLADFFRSFDDGVVSRNISSNAFIEGILAFIELHLGNKRSSSRNSTRKLMMHSVCIQLIGAVSERTGRELSETQVNRMGIILKETIVSASAIASVQAIGLQYDVVSTVSKMGRAIRPEFGEASLQPLVESINHTIARPSWYYIAPSVSSLESFVKALPVHLRGLVPNSMPALAIMLLKSRLQGKLFSILTEETIDLMNDMSYSAMQESRFLLACCKNVAKDSFSFLGDKSILMKSGSKVFVHRDKDGNVLAMVVVPLDGKLKPSSEILSAIGASKYDSHSISSNCEMKIDTLCGSPEKRLV